MQDWIIISYKLTKIMWSCLPEYKQYLVDNTYHIRISWWWHLLVHKFLTHNLKKSNCIMFEHFYRSRILLSLWKVSTLRSCYCLAFNFYFNHLFILQLSNTQYSLYIKELILLFDCRPHLGVVVNYIQCLCVVVLIVLHGILQH